MASKSPLAMSEDFIVPSYGREARRLFFTNPEMTNLNHGSFGTIPIPVQRACEALFRECEGNPDGFIRGHLFSRLSEARQVFSELVGVDPDTCVFVSNVSTALNTVLHNFKWSSKDHIVYTDAAYDSIYLAISNIPEIPQTSVFEVGNGSSQASILERFKEHIRNVKKELHPQSEEKSAGPGRKIVVIMETITATPSIYLPWKDMVRICKEESVWSIVDAAHSLGQEQEINLGKIDPDFWMTNCSKWYYAQRGCAILYVPLRNQDMIKFQLVPGITHPVRNVTPTNFIHKFYWTGSMDPVALLSINFARAFRQRLGGEKKINDYCHSLAVAGGNLVAKILGTGVWDSTEQGELTANMTNVELPIRTSIKPSREIFFFFQDNMMDHHKIFAPLFHYQERWWVRASAQIYNDLSDFERLGESLIETCRKINGDAQK